MCFRCPSPCIERETLYFQAQKSASRASPRLIFGVSLALLETQHDASGLCLPPAPARVPAWMASATARAAARRFRSKARWASASGREGRGPRSCARSSEPKAFPQETNPNVNPCLPGPRKECERRSGRTKGHGYRSKATQQMVPPEKARRACPWMILGL